MWPVLGALAVLFVLLALWQRGLERSRSRAVLATWGESRERGTHRALSQFPNINPYLCIGCESCIRACPEEGVIGMVNGVARVVYGARCIGHALCEKACPVGAIQVGFGDVSSREDIPALSDCLETNMPNLFIAGELGGIALVRHAVAQGTAVAAEIADRVARGGRGMGDVLDLAIVGAGPAGLAASLKATEKKLTHVVLDREQPGGTIRKYPRRKMTLIQTLDLPLHGRLPSGEYRKEELLALWERLIQQNRLPVRSGVAMVSVKKNGQVFDVMTSAGLVRAVHVVLALGRRGVPRKLGVPGEEHDHVLYQLIDAASYTDTPVVVVGGGDSAIEAAIALADQPGNTVVLSYRRAEFVRLKKRNEDRLRGYLSQGRIQGVLPSEVERIEKDRVVLKWGSGEILTVPARSVFVFAGGEPPFDLLKQMGVAMGVQRKRHAALERGR